MADLGFGPGENLFKYDPLKTWQYELLISGLADAGDELLKLVLIDCDRPKVKSDEIVVHHFNDRFKLAGKVDYQEIKFTMMDAVPNSETGKYASEIISTWRDEVFNPLTNEMQAPSVYKRNAKIVMYNGLKEQVEEFNIIGCWPKDVDYGKTDYKDTTGIITISVTLAVDKAFLVK